AAVALLLDEAALLEEAQVTRDAGLGDAEDRGQLADVQPLLLEEAQDAQAGFVAQQPEEGGRRFHISKYRYSYKVRQERDPAPPFSGAVGRSGPDRAIVRVHR